MDRVWDYLGFVIWFTGLGYIVLWLLGKFDRPVLPPALHAVGLMAAIFAALRLLLLARTRMRAASAATVAAPVAPASSHRRTPARPLRSVKPRSQFGLRGQRH
jgi:hypothetical protein